MQRFALIAAGGAILDDILTSHQGRIQPISLRAAISVIFGSQVS